MSAQATSARAREVIRLQPTIFSSVALVDVTRVGAMLGEPAALESTGESFPETVISQALPAKPKNGRRGAPEA
jgi:hypothetical protein